MSRLIKMAANLLMGRPSTDKQDFPYVPNYYFREVNRYIEIGRKSAIEMRKAHDRIQKAEKQLEAVRNMPTRRAEDCHYADQVVTDEQIEAAIGEDDILAPQDVGRAES